MSDLTITSSSNILPNSFFWKNLEKNNNISFADFGLWAHTLINAKNEENVISILFVKDFFNFIYNDKDLEEKLFLIEDIFTKRVLRDRGFNLLLFSSYSEINILETTRISTAFNKKITDFFNNMYLLSENNKNFIFCNLDKIFSQQGYNNCFDYRNWYLSRCHLSARGLELISATIDEILLKKIFAPKKILALDCDNTLWGGIIAEDGLNNLILGQDGYGKAFQDFQKVIKSISNKGILIALLSKNIENDVMNVFDKHNSMILKKEDITISKINWKEKADNIIEISSELNLGLDSIVFWDDNPIEREKVRIRIPEVTVIEPPEDVFSWPYYLRFSNYFSQLEILNEDTKKKEQYKIRSKFIENKKNYSSEFQYLKTIKLEPKIFEISEDNISRASQMTLKTNQFNFKTLRLSESEIEEKIKNSEFIFMVSLKDVYGDHGNVGLINLKKINDKEIYCENFLMSCRVIGRCLEFWILKKIIDKSLNMGFEKIKLEYINTKRNSIVVDFINKLNIVNFEIKNNNKIIFEINIKKFKVPNLEIFD